MSESLGWDVPGYLKHGPKRQGSETVLRPPLKKKTLIPILESWEAMTSKSWVLSRYRIYYKYVDKCPRGIPAG